MMKIDNFNNIHVNKGETFDLTIQAEDENGTAYVFQPGDKVVFSISEDYDPEKYNKEITVEVNEETDRVPFSFDSDFTDIEDNNDEVGLHYDIKLITAAGKTQTIMGPNNEQDCFFVIYPSFYKGDDIG